MTQKCINPCDVYNITKTSVTSYVRFMFVTSSIHPIVTRVARHAQVCHRYLSWSHKSATYCRRLLYSPKWPLSQMGTPIALFLCILCDTREQYECWSVGAVLFLVRVWSGWLTGAGWPVMHRYWKNVFWVAVSLFRPIMTGCFPPWKTGWSEWLLTPTLACLRAARSWSMTPYAWARKTSTSIATSSLRSTKESYSGMGVPSEGLWIPSC